MATEKIGCTDELPAIIVNNERLSRAFFLASELHKGQTRKSKEPYINHCLGVLRILNEEWGIEDENYLIAALFHDTVEDTAFTITQIEHEFGDEVAELVEGVTKLEQTTDQDELRKIITRSYLNPGVAVLKIADRLHNMRTLGFMPRDKQQKKAAETRNVYTRLAESLGMWVVKTELEDLCFKYLDPELYEKLSKEIAEDNRNAPLFVANVESHLQQVLERSEINATVTPRQDGVYALQTKREKQSMAGKSNPENFEDIEDLRSFRIQVDSENDIYRALQEIHNQYGGRVNYDKLDMFIGANARVNGYQAVQTTLSFQQGPIEVAIMTREMEEFNNWGVVSLIRRSKTEQLRNYVLKIVFTPKGSIRFLPQDATGFDMAAEINPRLLAEAVGIEIDGVQSQLSTIIPNGSRVNVLIGNESRAPIPGAELFCLPSTRRLIQEQRQLEQRDKLVLIGMQKMETILTPRGLLVLTDIGDKARQIFYRLGCQGPEEFHFKVGNGSISKERLEKELDLTCITKADLKLSTIRVSGADGPGILRDIIEMVSELGKNIAKIDHKDGGKFVLRMVIPELSETEIEIISARLQSDDRFTEKIIV